MNNKPSVESQFLVAFLAFTSLLYVNVWLMTQSARPAATAGYAVDSQPAQGVPPDFSSMSREEVGEYLVREAQKQLNQPNNYFAAATTVTGDTASAAPPPPANAPASSFPTPTPTPQQMPFSQCNLLQNQGSSPYFRDRSQIEFEGPRAPNAPLPPSQTNRQNPGEYYLARINLNSLNSVEVVHFGNNPAGPPQGVSTIFRSGNGSYAKELAASDRFIIFALDISANNQAVIVFWAGNDGIFGTGDDVPSVIFDTRLVPGVWLPVDPFYRRAIDIAGDKVAFLLNIIGTNQYHILQATLGPNGAPVSFSVPTVSRAFNYPAGTYLKNIRSGASGSVAFEFVPPFPNNVRRAAFLSPGLDGVWDSSPTADDQIVTVGGSGSHPFPEEMDLSKTGRMFVTVLANYVFPSPGILQMLYPYDAGPDLVPNTGDEQVGPLFLPQGISPGTFSGIEVGDPMPQLGVGRASTFRLATLYRDAISAGKYLLLVEDGGDSQLGVPPDMVIPTLLNQSNLLDPPLLASEQVVGLFFERPSYVTVTQSGIRWCIR